MRRGASLWIGFLVIWTLCVFPAFQAAANTDSVSDLAKWDVTSYKVNLRDLHGGSGDIQADQNGWVHLGANHLEGGDVKYDVYVGDLRQTDILEVWIDGYSTSNDLNVGPTVFVGTGKNRYEQITRLTGDAWRPFVFRFADDAIYGDVTDPSNRNENWRIRYPSSKYEVRRIDKSPAALLDNGILPVRISMTGAEDFIVKRVEVVAYRDKQDVYGDGLFIVKLEPYTVRRGGMVAVHLNRALPTENVDFYIVDPSGRERRFTPSILNIERNKIALYVDEYLFSKSGQYQVKLVDYSSREGEHVDIERFEYVHSRVVTVPRPQPTPAIQSPEVECPPAILPPVPQTSPGYIVPVPAAVVPTQPPVYSRGYTIQIGAFRVQSAAISICERLRREGYDAYIVESMKGNARLFRVRVGRYPNKSLALRDANQLRSRGFDTWITERS